MNVMVEAAEKAGRALVRDFGEVENLQVSRKGPGDFVSNADHKSEKIILAVLQKARPSYALLMEESGEIKGADAEYRWIVDPLDGTTNFLHGIPHWCVTIALEKSGEVIAGVTYDPIKDELFTAEKGTGAFVNNRRIRVANRTGLEDALIADDVLHPKDAIAIPAATSRMLGSAALNLAYVAAGRFDGYCGRGPKAWDFAAGSLMVREAGGDVSDHDGGKDFMTKRNIVAGNPAVQGALLKAIQAAKQVKPAS